MCGGHTQDVWDNVCVLREIGGAGRTEGRYVASFRIEYVRTCVINTSLSSVHSLRLSFAYLDALCILLNRAPVLCTNKTRRAAHLDLCIANWWSW